MSGPRSKHQRAARAAARLRLLGGDPPDRGLPSHRPRSGSGVRVRPSDHGWVPEEDALPGEPPDGGLPGGGDTRPAAGPLRPWPGGARLDPGLSGAAVLVALAVTGAALAAWFLLGARPATVPAPPPATVVDGTGSRSPAGTGESPPPPSSVSRSPTGGSPSGRVPAGEPPAEVVVAVAGRVARPGVVRLPAGSRVVDAVEAAGGLVPGGDLGLLNLARVLADGEQVLVGVDPPPGPGTTGPGPGPAPAAATDGQGRVDLNRATAADLDSLPGVGPVLAARIVEHRERVGRFAGVEQLREVDGIGESRYADLEPRVVVQ